MPRPYSSDLNLAIRCRITPDMRQRLDRRLAIRRKTDPTASVSDLVREAIAASVGLASDSGDQPSGSTPRPSRAEVRAELERTLSAGDAMNATARKARDAQALAGDPPEPERFELPHLVQSDGSCAGGCDPDTTDLCVIGPDDPRRTGKRR